MWRQPTKKEQKRAAAIKALQEGRSQMLAALSSGAKRLAIEDGRDWSDDGEGQETFAEVDAEVKYLEASMQEAEAKQAKLAPNRSDPALSNLILAYFRLYGMFLCTLRTLNVRRKTKLNKGI